LLLPFKPELKLEISRLCGVYVTSRALERWLQSDYRGIRRMG
jgi:hypothetical protein